MRRQLMDILQCPACSRGLTLAAENETPTRILSGTLSCSQCGRQYPIVRGVPRFVRSEKDEPFGLQWTAFRLEQLDSHNGTDISRQRLESELGERISELHGTILDVGCGAGRFIDVASSGNCHVVGVEITAAVDAAQRTLGSRSNVDLVQADLYKLPFASGAFDLCYCIGVIQHTPEPLRALQGLPRVVREGGKIAVTIYERNRWTIFYPKYLLRPITRRMPKRWLLRMIRAAMPVLFPLTEILFRIPVLGRLFRFAIPVANYIDEARLNIRQRYRWSVLDTFDMLAPTWDQPLAEEPVRSTLNNQGVGDVVRLANSGLNLVGTKGGTRS